MKIIPIVELAILYNSYLNNSWPITGFFEPKRKMKAKLLQIILNKWSSTDISNRIIVSVILIVTGALLAFFILPKIVELIITFLLVAKPGRYIRSRQEGTLQFSYKLYLWNVTNPNEIMAGTEKPILQEVGPYVFQ